MANEKRLIDASELEAHFQETKMIEIFPYWKELSYKTQCELVRFGKTLKKMMQNAPTVDAVPAEQFNALKSLVNGEWVDCKLVQEALGIDFATGLKMFDFSRTAEWNPAPLNGQKITTKFRMKNAVEVVHGRWEFLDPVSPTVFCSVCKNLAPLDDFAYYHSARTNYCPNCGAKMDGDGND